ncbi:C40 family peptidase [Actinomadura macra]|uniref:C40 family peptidase n=1 Tax=Actinomadura macra TaxID=46164 RepID=UPI00083565A7|nr:bifunctional lytic transglycosylase/C40 family peptidase [Actinomadura macra]
MPLVIGGAAAVLVFAAVFVAVLGAVIPGSGAGTDTCPPGTSAPGQREPIADIPSAYLGLYMMAAQRYGIGWSILAAVGKVESDHGRGSGPGITSGTNHAGAAGPMQFLAGTWAAFGVDGNNDGHRNIYDPADAIPAAARYLRHNGAPEKIRTALLRYNRSGAYVTTVLHQADAYAKAGTPSTREPRAQVAPCDPAGLSVGTPSAAAARAIAFARAQLDKPYVWGAEGPDAYDCSGLTHTAYRAAGVSIPRVSGDQWQHGPRISIGRERPGDLVFFDSGPSTSTARPGHVGLVIGNGKMIAAPHTGTVVQIQPYTRPDLLGFTRPTAHQ